MAGGLLTAFRFHAAPELSGVYSVSGIQNEHCLKWRALEMRIISNQDVHGRARSALLVWCVATLASYGYLLTLALLMSIGTNLDLVGIFLRGSYFWAPVIGIFLVAPVVLYLLGARSHHILAWIATVLAIAAPSLQAYIVGRISNEQWEQGLAVEGWAQFVGFAPFIGVSVLLSISAHILLLGSWTTCTISAKRYAIDSIVMAVPLIAWLVMAVAWSL